MTDVEYTPDEIDEIGRGPVNDLANFYDDAAVTVKLAGAERDSTFQNDAISDRWNSMFNLLSDGLAESAVNVRAFSQGLIETAEAQRDAEWTTEQEFEELASELGNQYTEEVAEIQRDGSTPGPSQNYPEPPPTEVRGETRVQSQEAESPYDL